VDFEKFLYNAFANNPQYPLLINGKKAVIRFQLNTATPDGGYIGKKAGVGSPSLRTVIVVKNPKLRITRKGELTTPFSFDDISILFVTIISRGTYICLNSGVMAQTFQSL